MKINYVIVSCVKDEIENIKDLVKSVFNQQIIPYCWIIIDDYSTDGTYEYLISLQQKNDSIVVLRDKQDSKYWDNNIRYAKLCNLGFAYIQSKITQEINIDYIVVLDGDIILSPNYFKYLIEQFQKNPKLGIASGFWKIKNRDKNSFFLKDIPIGAARIYKYSCFIDCMPFELDYGPDVISLVKAKLKGWECKLFSNVFVYQSRDTDARVNKQKSAYLIGEILYYYDYNPILIIARFLRYIFNNDMFSSFHFLQGWIDSWNSSKRKISNQEIREYFFSRRWKEVLSLFLNKKGGF